MPRTRNSRVNPNPLTIPSLLAGIAGEYFVAAELSRRGFIASISLRNTRGIDILATNEAATRSVTVQCKTNQIGDKVWLLNEKCEEFFPENHYYVFVALGPAIQRPSFHIVPSKIVAVATRESHEQWRQTPRRDGGEHGKSAMRKFTDYEDAYLDKWDLLGL
jgi:hypothetical protein